MDSIQIDEFKRGNRLKQYLVFQSKLDNLAGMPQNPIQPAGEMQGKRTVKVEAKERSTEVHLFNSTFRS